MINLLSDKIFQSSGLEKERAGRKHFALKFLDKTVPDADRIFCYIMYKLPDGTVSVNFVSVFEQQIHKTYVM